MSMNTLLPTARPTQSFVAHMHRWKFSALATAAILSAGLYGTDASALALGRVNVQSALGEPLRAEIELPQITAAEAESLRVAPARPEVFRSQGLEYSPAAGNVQIQLHRRADGSMVLRAEQHPPHQRALRGHGDRRHVELGPCRAQLHHAVRPSGNERAPATATTAPQLTAARRNRQPRPAQRRPPGPARGGTGPRGSGGPPCANGHARSQPPAVAAASGSGDEVRVRPGDTAGRIANAHRPASVSLDQMLVAMAQANPDAFVQGNVNRLRAGTVLRMPSEADAQATPAVQARQIVAAQSRDFNEYRRAWPGRAAHASGRRRALGSSARSRPRWTRASPRPPAPTS
ncbi:FimV N-terminal domain-containing protein [Alicycliphilus sp. B1]|nr:FimV N-terminal domain-containing protein [Alicycliphilus sp. B1]